MDALVMARERRLPITCPPTSGLSDVESCPPVTAMEGVLVKFLSSRSRVHRTGMERPSAIQGGFGTCVF